MQNKNTKNKRRKMAVEVIAISAAMVFALVSNINGHNMQIAIAATKNNNSPTTISSSSSSNPNQMMSSSSTTSLGSTDKASKLVLALRDLWVDHTGWTRNYIISFVAGLPDTNLVAQRLLKNQEDIGNAIKPFYGSEAGNKLTSLLKDHILGAVDLLKAAKAGNTTGAAAAEKKWYENADQIATFLSTANPNWSKVALKNMLDNHLALTKAEAVARLTGNYAADIATYDKVRQEANMMSDALVDGIVKQFPDKFSSTVATTSTTTTIPTTITE
ncbi:MAG TPA: hypothetical protein VE223_01965 [Nitrososphaeraceae archaeon]|nr:hypothetical protein [Nitrososphaeraceae archaeon]